ncbi:unnamed protein product [Closterium sp. NIES-53]
MHSPRACAHNLPQVSPQLGACAALLLGGPLIQPAPLPSPLPLSPHAIPQGVRPIIPPKCPPDLAHVLRCCWEGAPSSRPSMPQVISLLRSLNVFATRQDDPARDARLGESGAGNSGLPSSTSTSRNSSTSSSSSSKQAGGSMGSADGSRTTPVGGSMSDNRPQRGAKPSLLSSLGSSIGRFSFSRGRSPHVTPPPAFSTPSPSPSPSSASPLPLPASASESTAAVSVTRASLAVVPATAAASTAAAAAPSDVVALGERQAVREPAGSGPACVVATAGKIIGLNGTSGTVTTEGRSVESTAQSGSLDHDSTADAREGITEGRSHILQHLPSSHPTSTSPHRNAPPLPLIPPSEPSYLPNNPPSPIPPTLPSHTTIPASLPSPHPSPLHSSLPPPSPHPSSSSRSSHPSPPESSFPPYSPSAAASISPSVSAATATGAAAISAGGMGLRGYAIAGQVAGANPAAAAAAAAAATANSDANPEASPEANTEASIGASTGCVGWEGGSAADSISPVGSARSIGWEAGGGITAAGNASPAGSMGSMGSMRSVGWEGELMSAAWSGEAGQAWVGERPVWEMKLRNVVLKKEIAKGSSGTVYKGKYKDCPVAGMSCLSLSPSDRQMVV